MSGGTANDASAMGGVYLRQGSATAAATLTSIDNIAVAVTVPEPASAIMLIGAMAYVGATVRRRS